jgi:hypothetical protein
MPDSKEQKINRPVSGVVTGGTSPPRNKHDGFYAFSDTSPDPQGSLFIVDHFSMGITENMLARFDTIGATSANSYSNLIRVQISGRGQSNGPIVNDAFYYLDPFLYGATRPHPKPPGLAISFTGDPRTLEGDGVKIAPFITFFDGEGFGSYDGVTAPAFNPSHFYDFIIDIGPTSKQISLGTGDGGLFDNTGQYN